MYEDRIKEAIAKGLLGNDASGEQTTLMLDDVVVKQYCDPTTARRIRAITHHLKDSAPVACTKELLEIEGKTYLVLERLPGESVLKALPCHRNAASDIRRKYTGAVAAVLNAGVIPWDAHHLHNALYDGAEVRLIDYDHWEIDGGQDGAGRAQFLEKMDEVSRLMRDIITGRCE